MKILVDMNLSPDWVEVFARHNIEAVHWSQVGDPRAPDRVIMAWAKSENYIVFTNDLDFGSLLASTQANTPSVIQARTQDLLSSTLENLVIDALSQFAAELKSGALITIDPYRARARILPILPN